MAVRVTREARAGFAVLVAMAMSAHALAQGRTDIVVLANSDHITGEIIQLDRGRLEFKTDDAGTLYLEWDKLVSVVTKRLLEVVQGNGTRLVGSLAPAPSREVLVVHADGVTSLPMADITIIRQVGRSFWSNLDGSFDVGFSYTRSSGIAQLNLNTDTIYRRPASRARLTASLTQTDKNDGTGRDDRATVDMSYLKYPWQRWFIGGAGRFETNESLGLELRSQIAGFIGPRLISSNRAQLSLGAGLAANKEKGVDVETTSNVEALFVFQTSFYTYDRPKTNLDLSVQYYPSLSNTGRHRLQVDAGVKREFFKDLFVALNFYNTFDSRPPNPSADTNDIGVVLSIGWSY
jgi:Protein of unknown function, DUF481